MGIIGREEELAAVEGFLDGLAEAPGALVLFGEAGIGKTILWESGVEEAGRRFGQILTCRGAEAEASFAFAGLSELLAGVVDEVLPGLASPRRRALEVALKLAEPGDAAPDAHVIGLALLDVLRALAEPGPVLVALDDLQWLDAASAVVLNVAVRRLRDERIGVLATVRQPPGTSAHLELERSFPDERWARLDLDAQGTVCRQAQQKAAARGALEQALAVFEGLGARPWAERARAELRRVSGRRPPAEGLTETERRVAELAARGRTNKEIAAELFMGVSTVEAHLSHVYRKLGVRRAGLAARLVEPRDATPESVSPA